MRGFPKKADSWQGVFWALALLVVFALIATHPDGGVHHNVFEWWWTWDIWSKIATLGCVAVFWWTTE